MQNRLLSTKRVLEPLKVTKVAGDGVISGSWSLRWPGKGRAPYLLLDFGQKVSGLLRIKSRRLDGSYPGVRYAYGPYGDFTPFEFTAGFGDWQSEELCVFRFLKITVASEFPCPAHVAIESVSLVRTE